jgi:hypothetical protein
MMEAKDAPCHYASAEADAWASGFNRALEVDRDVAANWARAHGFAVGTPDTAEDVLHEIGVQIAMMLNRIAALEHAAA